ncbi:MAG: electron transfer flavoprotein subunit alpha/FixB family protein [Clostridia bacterium]
MIIQDEKDKAKYSNVWVVAELLAGKLQPVTHELVGAARTLADQRASEVWVVIMGSQMEDQAAALYASGADKVVIVDDPRLAGFVDEIEANVLVRLIEKYLPEILICGATTRGRALIPRVSIMTNCGLTADCTELGIDPNNGDFLQTRPAFGGNIMATIRCSKHRPQMATVRPMVMKAPEPDYARSGVIIYEKLLDSDASKSKKIIETFHSDSSAVNLSDAQIIIAGGRGMKGVAGFDLLRSFAAKVGGAVGATRAAVDAGWIAYAHQVGQTGQTVQTQVYIACAISGQIQHLVGMQSCDTIIAIDKNPNTPMMQIADIAITGDVFEIIPELIKEIAEQKVS